uniref:Alkaline ceramidase n=1 Tax=Oncorhynchus tshawytscha TaxID=74940 RepID=A0A8C8CQL3_ONCTS
EDDVFSYESSDLDWCEANYRHSEVHCMSSLFVFYLYLVWIMMVFVGVSLLCLLPHDPELHGQMLDEQSILWVLGMLYSPASRREGLPRPTLCSFVKPTDNAYILNCLVLWLCWSGVGLWGMAIIYWINDCFGCILWQKLNLCYLHGIWHILIVTAVAYPSTLIAYLDANYEMPGLQYWPSDNCVLGLPYIVLKGTTKTQKRC